MASKAPSGSKSSSSWTKSPGGSPGLLRPAWPVHRGQDPLPRALPLPNVPHCSLCRPSGPSSCLSLPPDPHPGQPPACPVLFCTSLLPGDRPTKNSPCSLSRPQLPKEQEMRGARRLMSRSPPQTPSSEPCPALQPGTSANLAISGASHTPSLGGGLPISAYNHRAVPTL